MKGVHQMREDHTEDMELNKEMEDIRQVPLEPGSRTAPGRERPVGASYTGGAARPGNGAPGMDESTGRAVRPRSGASGLDEGVGRAPGSQSGAAQTGSQGYGCSRARGNREAQEARTRKARMVPAEEEGRRGGPGTAGARPPKARNQRTGQPPLESAPREVTLRQDEGRTPLARHPAGA